MCQVGAVWADWMERRPPVDSIDTSPASVDLTQENEQMMPPLPEPDGSAVQEWRPYPRGGHIHTEVDAWSAPLVRAYAVAYAAIKVARERERCAKVCENLLSGSRDPMRQQYAAAIRKGE